MKFALALVFAFVAVVCAQEDAGGAMQISGNNVGDIVTIGLNANLVASNQMEQNILSVIIALLNQQAVVAGATGQKQEIEQQ